MAAQTPTQPQQQPMIVKYVQSVRDGIRPQSLIRHAIGYVIRGTKYIYDGDRRQQVSRGEAFYLGAGHHYMEDIPDGDKPFEQIIFFYTPVQLSRILSNLNMTYNLPINNDHSCQNCRKGNFVAYPAWNALRNFFITSNQYLRENIFASDEIAGNIKMTELIYLILTQPDCCLKTKILGNADTLHENFEQMVRSHIFSDISIESLAEKCNRSMTAFKMEFRRHFEQPPHRWFIHQRLMHSRLLLISTNKSISEIGNECTFPNTSHFIKLFKKEYGLTPASYRHREAERQNSAQRLPKTRQAGIPATA